MDTELYVSFGGGEAGPKRRRLAELATSRQYRSGSTNGISVGVRLLRNCSFRSASCETQTTRTLNGRHRVIEISDRVAAGSVLVVDDDDSVRLVTSRILTRFGFDVIDVASGRAGLDVLQDSARVVSAVVLDWSMPGMTGAETLCAIRSLDEDMSIIVLTGWSLSIEEELPEIAGPIPVLQKPFDPMELIELVRGTDPQT